MHSNSDIIEAVDYIRRLSTAIDLMASMASTHPTGEGENHLPAPFPCNNKSKAAIARRRLASRRLRDRFFDHGLFVEPAWDMMLDLYASHYEGKRISVSSLTIASSVPATTALRWISKLADSGQMIREPDPSDRRKVYITLAPDVIAKLDEYFIATREIVKKFEP